MKFNFRIRKLLAGSLYKSAFKRSFFTLWGIFLKESRVSFSQFFTFKYPVFSLLHTFSVIFSALLRLWHGRSLKYSFSFTGEDRIIESLIKPLITYNGTYVDVGCNHPKFLSNTYSLYRKGWKGICIDANEKLVNMYAKYRPKDLSVCALVSDIPNPAEFYTVENEVLSTIDKKLSDHYKSAGLRVTKSVVQPWTLTEILDSCSFPAHFDLLTIDTEDHDYQVLCSLDFTRYSPVLIVVEDDTFNFKSLNSNKFCIFMEQKGYTLVAAVLDNLYFRKNMPGANLKHSIFTSLET